MAGDGRWQWAMDNDAARITDDSGRGAASTVVKDDAEVMATGAGNGREKAMERGVCVMAPSARAVG